MQLPPARGPMSDRLITALRRPPHDPVLPVPGADDPVTDDDLQVSLFVAYELHYRGFAGVDDRWEWQPGLLAWRLRAEEVFEQALRGLAGPLPATLPGGVARALADLVAADDGPALSRHLERRATLAQFREFAMHRAVYQLREADPHTFAVPRLSGRAKAALVEIQMDEYGGGSLARMHCELFRTTLGCLGLSQEYGAYVDAAPAVTLATNNLMSLFALHRRHRGAIIGHLAAYEMTSSLPNRRYGNGLRRLGFGPEATRFYDEHVEADAVHEQIAAHDLCGSFCADEPAATADVLFGAASALAVDRLFAGHLLDRWAAGGTSLRAPRRFNGGKARSGRAVRPPLVRSGL